jgi:4-amino-4-deoxy-L-arabinose transferase-like glycosyltransferase
MGRVADGNGRARPFWYFAAVLPVFCWPWTVAAFPAALAAFRRRREDAGAFAIASTVPAFIIFSIARSKLPSYVLPLTPGIALAIGVWAAAIRARPARRSELAIEAATWLVVAAGSLAILFVPLAEAGARLLGASAGVILMAVMALALSRRGDPAGATRRRLALPIAAAALLQVLNVAAARAENTLSQNSSRRDLALAARLHAPHGAVIRCDPDRTDELAFADGPRIVAWRLNACGAGLHLFGAKPEYLPVFGRGTRWELEARRRAARPLDAARLEVLSQDAAPLLVLTRSRYACQLDGILARPHRVIARFGAGRDEVSLVLQDPPQPLAGSTH